MSWFRLADRLKTPLQELQQKTSSSEFVEWMHYLEIDQNEPSKQDLYLAQLACEVRRSFVDKPSEVKADNFILKFVPKSVGQDNEESQRRSSEDSIKKSQQAWAAAIGLKLP